VEDCHKENLTKSCGIGKPAVAAQEVAAVIAKIFVVAVIRRGCYASLH